MPPFFAAFGSVFSRMFSPCLQWENDTCQIVSHWKYPSAAKGMRSFFQMKSPTLNLIRWLALLVLCMGLGSAALAAPKGGGNGGGGDKSDLNADEIVDLDDLIIFSTNYLQQAYFQVDWCLFYESTIAGEPFEGEPTDYYLKHFKRLLAFIHEEFPCNPGPFLLELENTPSYLVRLTQSETGDFFISDARVGSVFIFDHALEPQLELKGLDQPLGVAIDSKGRILVGNSGRHNVEAYSASDGNLVSVLGDGQIKMPNAITIGPDGEIFITDSVNHTIWVFNADYQLIRQIGRPGLGEGGLNFPVDAEIIARPEGSGTVYELFVADQENDKVQIFDLQGNWLGDITFEGTPGQNCNWFTGVCEIPGAPEFNRLQALSQDSLGRLHVLDCFAAAVTVFDPATGDFLTTYGEYGESTGQLKVPMDLFIAAGDVPMAVAGDGDRIESFENP